MEIDEHLKYTLYDSLAPRDHVCPPLQLTKWLTAYNSTPALEPANPWSPAELPTTSCRVAMPKRREALPDAAKALSSWSSSGIACSMKPSIDVYNRTPLSLLGTMGRNEHARKRNMSFIGRVRLVECRKSASGPPHQSCRSIVSSMEDRTHRLRQPNPLLHPPHVHILALLARHALVLPHHHPVKHSSRV